MIKILRKKGSSVSWIVNAMFSMAFPLDQDEFEIPNIQYMAYLYNDFEVIEYTDENGKPVDITLVGMPCWFRDSSIIKKSTKVSSTVFETVERYSDKENT